MKNWHASVIVAFLLIISPRLLSAASSASYNLNKTVVDSAGTTSGGSGKHALDVLGESLAGQMWSRSFSIQAGFFNEYFMPAPTPTVTATPIRTFGGEIISKEYIYAAPNPIRGSYGNIYFDLALPAEVTLKIFTTNGDLVISQHWAGLQAGKNSWVWNTANIANGVYLLWIRAKADDGKTTTITKKIALVR